MFGMVSEQAFNEAFLIAQTQMVKGYKADGTPDYRYKLVREQELREAKDDTNKCIYCAKAVIVVALVIGALFGLGPIILKMLKAV
jgi:hypothetical protein